MTRTDYRRLDASCPTLGRVLTPSFRNALAALAVTGLVLATTGPAAAVNPEGDKNRKPDQDAGYFLGHPTETYMWHGCTKTSTQQTPATLDEGVHEPGKGNAHNKVTWTTTATTATTSKYVLSWKVADGWKICGAQAAILGSDPDAQHRCLPRCSPGPWVLRPAPRRG